MATHDDNQATAARRELVRDFDKLADCIRWAAGTVESLLLRGDDAALERADRDALSGVARDLDAARELLARLDELRPGADEEKLLQRIILANPRDRYKAMEIRKAHGTAAAVDYLGVCEVTDESYDDDVSTQLGHLGADVLDVQELANVICGLASTDPVNTPRIISVANAIRREGKRIEDALGELEMATRRHE